MFQTRAINWKFVHHITTIFLFLIPLIFWGHLAHIGGDDTRLYYYFPGEYLQKYIMNLIENNNLDVIGTYGPQSFYYPFILALSLLSIVVSKTLIQAIVYGAVLSTGYLFMHLLMSGLFGNEKKYQSIYILCSFIYSTSQFNYYTVWNHQLTALFLIPTFPLFLILFTKSLTQYKYCFLLALLISTFSIFLLAIPWTVGIILCSLPLFTYLFWKYKIRAIKSVVLITAVVVVVNLYWLVFLIDSYKSVSSSDSNVVSYTLSTKTASDNQNLITQVSITNNPIFPLLNTFHRDIQFQYSWNARALYQNWYQYTLALNSFYILCFALGFFLLKSKLTMNRLLILSVLACWILSLWLITVRIGSWGLPAFLYANLHMPGFVMFRNMFDKFGPAYAFYFSLALCSILVVITSNIRKKYTLSIMLVGFIVAILNAVPFIRGDMHNLPLWTTSHTYTRINDFNTNFYDLSAYIRNIKTDARVLWLPILRINYVIIQDKKEQDRYYIGPSPLQLLSSKTDLSGLLGLPFSAQLEDAILQGNGVKVGQIANKLNIGYVIVNNNISGELKGSYLLGNEFSHAQNDKLYKELLGRKLASFGSRYELYEINHKYQNTLLSIKDTKGQTLINKYEKVGKYDFSIQLPKSKGEYYIDFLYPYSSRFSIESTSPNRTTTVNHTKLHSYANRWKLKINANNEAEKIYIRFLPSSHQTPLNRIAWISYSTLLLLTIFLFIKQK